MLEWLPTFKLEEYEHTVINDFAAIKDETTGMHTNPVDHVPIYEDKISILLHLGTQRYRLTFGQK